MLLVYQVSTRQEIRSDRELGVVGLETEAVSPISCPGAYDRRGAGLFPSLKAASPASKPHEQPFVFRSVLESVSFERRGIPAGVFCDPRLKLAMTFAIGISGATGVTGEVTLRVLEERGFPVGELRLFASRSSAGQSIRWKGRDHAVEALEDGRFDGLDVVISATSAAIAREWAPRMVEAGAVVIDQSS